MFSKLCSVKCIKTVDFYCLNFETKLFPHCVKFNHLLAIVSSIYFCMPQILQLQLHTNVIKLMSDFFLFPSAYKSYVYNVLQSKILAIYNIMYTLLYC